MKKFIALGISVAVVVGLIASGTWAVFTDTEVVEDNSFCAGTIDIRVDPTDGQYVTTVDGTLDLKPCQTGWIEINVTNDGTNPAEIWKHIANVENQENEIVDAEGKFYDAWLAAWLLDNPGGGQPAPEDIPANWKLSDWIHYDMTVCRDETDCELLIDEEEGFFLTGLGQILYTTKSIPSGSSTNVEIYELNVTMGTATLLTTLTGGYTSPSNPNGNAWDPVNNRLYFTNAGTKELFFWDFDATTTAVIPAGTTVGTVAGAGFFNGAYYYISNGTDDLRKVTFNPDGTIATGGDTLLKANFDGGVGVTYWFGDIAIIDDGDDGMLYGGAKVQSGDREHFFSIDLTSPGYTYTLIDGTWAGLHTQMAFGADGTLYAPSSGVWNAVDLSNGDLNTTGVSTDPAVRIPDLATGQPKVGVECHWIYLGVLQPGESILVKQSYHLDSAVDNWGQSDKVTFDMEFVAQQIEGALPDPPGDVLPGHGRPGDNLD